MQQREQALAKTALALLIECDVTPTPENFELFYLYATGTNPHLAHQMGEMISQRRTFTLEILEVLRRQCLPSARVRNAVDALGDNMASAIDTALKRIGVAERDAVAYGQRLSAAQGEFGTDQAPDAMRKVIDRLQSATRKMEERTRNLEKELQRSSHEVNELKSKLADVRKESLIDPLTHIANRRAFDIELASAAAHTAETDQPVSLLMCDIDHFKRFNDTWGHQIGDQVLRLVASALAENVKGRDTAARYGGEEFAVILRNAKLEHAMKLAEEIRLSVESKDLLKKSTGDILGRITVSIGVAQFARREAPGDVVRRADSCLYAAKRSGRNCVVGETDARAGHDRAATG